MVSGCARHPTATVVATPIATKGKAPAGNVFAGVTVVPLVMMDCGCYLDRGERLYFLGSLTTST
jgi:hypothetical protein